MTEDEAKTKWCPFVQITAESDDYIPQTNRFEVASKGGTRCIGSACMAFRWVDKQDWETIKDAKVYCGLAGKP